ncbi:MAG TPA: hypothetical protein VGG27_02315 [Magnetospirillaceae bacterium]|jgi:hypothetical protein
MRVTLAWILGIGLSINALAMLGWPEPWYGVIPGVSDTGPFNPHFVRDIGCAYLTAGVGMIGFAIDRRFRDLALGAVAFLVLHALVHLWDGLAGREPMHNLLADLPSVFLAPVLALWIAWPRRIVSP